MSKKFIITEEEKKDIKLLYNINEQTSDDNIDTETLKRFISLFLPKILMPELNIPTTQNSGSSSVPSITTSDDDFYKSVLKCIGAQPTKDNMLFMYAWRQSEGGRAKNNPFNTTQKMPGATNISNTSVGVKNYSTPEEGIEATCKTLKNGRDKYGYDKIIDGLKNDIGLSKLADAVVNSKWGTEDLLRKVSQGYIAGHSPKPHPINQTEIV